MKKIIALLLTLMLCFSLCGCEYAYKYFDLDLKSEFSQLDFSIAESDTQQSINHTANLIEKEIYKSIEEILINEGVNEYEIYIDTKVDEATNEIVLQEVTVLVDEIFKEKISVLESILKTEFGEVLKIGVKENG